MRKALTLYVNPGSNVTEGLRRRRNAEADVWFTNVKEG
jgi:GH24 family phage-related lysozyme (muramidase)